MNDVLILIPARFHSSRFPRKLLADIDGQSVIQKVMSNCQSSGIDTAIVTDSPEVEEHLKAQGQVVRIDDEVASGSERIGLAFDRYFSNKAYQYIINVQGDEPLLLAEDIRNLAQFHKEHDFDICTMVKERDRQDSDFHRPDVVKAVYFKQTRACLYFSRAAIPFDRDGTSPIPWYQHIGVYSYRVEALKKFVNASVSLIEDCEKLEQLRALEQGMNIGAMECLRKLIGVDTPEDLEKVKEELLGESEK